MLATWNISLAEDRLSIIGGLFRFKNNFKIPIALCTTLVYNKSCKRERGATMKRLDDTRAVHVRIPIKHLERLDEISGSRGGVSTASIIREAVKKFIDKKGDNKK